MTKGQQLSVDQLNDIASYKNGALEIINIEPYKYIADWFKVSVSIDCSIYKKNPNGIPLRQRERLYFLIPPDFPFKTPEVCTFHTRFAGYPHVQWKRSLCLFQSTATEWDANNGMFGFLDRLHLWLERAALNELDPIGLPLHPPVAYISSKQTPLIIPKANTPDVPDQGWFGLACIQDVSADRVDIIGWSENHKNVNTEKVAAAILLTNEFPFEYPSDVNMLINELENHGIPRSRLFLGLQYAVLDNNEDDPLYLIVGTPQRGIQGSDQKLQHLSVWYINPTIAKGLKLALSKYSQNSKMKSIGDKVEQIIIDWTKTAKVEWCRVREDRSEIVIQRDHSSALSYFKGKTISLWGCGALGSHVAEYLVRAGIKKIILRDYSRVAPGLICRQLYNDIDIGKFKSNVLAERLKKIGLNSEFLVEPVVGNILKHLDSDSWHDSAEIIIDTTASRNILHKLETIIRKNSVKKPLITSMMIGHAAENGLVILTGNDNVNGPHDIIRKAKLAAANKPNLKYFIDEFWPKKPRSNFFQPEPGCSDPTFVGSETDVATLSGIMLNVVSQNLKSDSQSTSYVNFIKQPYLKNFKSTPTFSSFEIEPDIIIDDPFAGYQIRLSISAWKEIKSWINKSRRINGEKVETGGILFGERDDVSKIIWVDEITGPPPDSIESEDYFQCGIMGISEANHEKKSRSRGSIQFVGMWHTHPQTAPLPSEIDVEGMHRIVNSTDPPTTQSLLLIVGSYYSSPAIGAFVFKREDFLINDDEDSEKRIGSIPILQSETSSNKIGLALSGGGSRAIAFHLGCLRALHDRGVINQIKVISSVSGGSVIGALYTYSDSDFEKFEAEVINLLRSGLQLKILKRFIFSTRLIESIFTICTSGVLALGSNIVNLLVPNKIKNKLFQANIHPPIRRWVSRTTSFMDVLMNVFGQKSLTDKRRNDLEIVINATELRTGSAFRFGSRESECWRFGKIVNNNVKVAQAVAASAAYPALLPALDLKFKFEDRDHLIKNNRVILSDGGIFDNLGVTCLEPDRSIKYSSNVFDLDYIISCNAGPGLFNENNFPYWWPSRMKRSFESVFRKAQDSIYKRLHDYNETGAIKGFILSYLGQQDQSLPYIPTDLVKREEVFNYPTDFAAMKIEDIERISLRGEQLTRLLIAQYCPDL